MTIRNVIVIGAGLAGMSTAFALARLGCASLVLERQAGAGLGASFANGGMLTPSMADPWNAPGVWRDLLRWFGREDAPMLLRLHAMPELALWGAQFLAASRASHFTRAIELNARLGLFSLEVMDSWRQDANLHFDSAQNGTMKIYRNRAAWEAGVGKSEVMARLGVVCEPMDGAQTLAYEPALTPIGEAIAGAVRFPRDQSGDARKFVEALAHVGEGLGVRVRYGAEVRRLLVRGGSVRGVLLADNEELQADAVVLATGPHAAMLARQAGVDLPIKPVKGYSISFPVRGMQGLPKAPLVDDALHAALTPLGQTLRVAGTAEFSGFDTRIRPERIENLRGLLRQILPQQAATLESEGGHAWAGLRPMHARGVPAIGPTRRRGLFVNAGHGHLGWTLAAGSGAALAQLMLGAPADFDLGPFAP
ncbi:MAG TPA: FAD-dependent oxidoreductase [Terricaulis sp.]|nr:FAD-dependent oxidoreductase [Terricaulis sp.]